MMFRVQGLGGHLGILRYIQGYVGICWDLETFCDLCILYIYIYIYIYEYLGVSITL